MLKEVKEGSWESRGAQKRGDSMVCEISQPKEDRCENRLPLRNCFAASNPPLRKFSQMRKFSQLRRDPLAHECHFTGQYICFATTKWLRNLHALKSSISQPRRHSEGCFAASKPPFGTRVPFCSCEMVAKSPCLKILQHAHHE